MPGTLNGIGTWYHGEANAHVRTGRCEGCGALAELRSYDTTLWLVFLFVPVYPEAFERLWDLGATWGIMWLGVPIEEIISASATMLFAGPFLRACSLPRRSSDRP